MPKAPSLCNDFYDWARPKLRPLGEARAEDRRAGVKRYGAFHKLREQYLAELETLPFGQVGFHAYLDADEDPILDEIELRDRAATWLRNHSRPTGTVQLAKFESKGGVSESASRVTSAAEMWAEGEKARIRKATCETLGIPVTTGNKALPSNWIGTRKSVVKREFASLPQADQEEWNALASRERDAAARDRGSVISIQERQLGFAASLDAAVAKQTKGRALGDVFVFQFSGYFVRAEDKQLERFRGQVSSDPAAPKWFQSEAYADVVSPAWTEFIHKDVGDRLLFRLNKPPPMGLPLDVLMKRREELAQYLEEMFRIDCDFATLDRTTFWNSVKENPSGFVNPSRLPNDIPFQDPIDMLEDDFIQVFRHIWRCQNTSHAVDRDARFIYEVDAIREFVLRERMHYLRHQQKRRARNAKAADEDGTAVSAPPQVEGPAAPPAAQTGAAAPSSASPRDDDDDDVVPSSVEQGQPTESPAPAPAQDEPAGPVNDTPPAPPAALAGKKAASARGVQSRTTPDSARASPDSARAMTLSARATPLSTSADGPVDPQPTVPGRKAASRRNRSNANAKTDKEPAAPKGRRRTVADKDKAEPENEAEAAPLKPPKAKAAPRPQKRKTRDASDSEEDKGIDMPPKKKGKAVPRPSKRKREANDGNDGKEGEGNDVPPNKKRKAAPRPQKRRAATADDDDEEYVAEGSKSQASSEEKQARVDPQPAVETRYPTRRAKK